MTEKPLFGDIMAKKIYERNISMSKFGRMIGISGHCIITYANHRRIPSADVFLKICNTLEIDPNEVTFSSRKR